MSPIIAAALLLLALPFQLAPDAAGWLLGPLAGATGLLLLRILPPPSKETQEALLAAAIM